MVAHIHTVAFEGVKAIDVDVQVSLASGLPAFTIVGLADKAVGESKERVRNALASMGLSLPPKRITVNLAPANILKEGSHYDLPIALGLLVVAEVLPQDALSNFVAMGELSLDGRLAPVSGVLPAAMRAAELDKGLICAASNGAEAKWAGEIDVLAPESLLALINHIKGTQLLSEPADGHMQTDPNYPDLKDIRGQEVAKRALEVAAAGGHHMLMVGPPGAGKSMLAARLPSIMPPLGKEAILETSIIQSINGDVNEGQLSAARPYREPHHNCSMPAMIGGGPKAKPGEVSLAHHGILFLDELPEFPSKVLDSLRQPLETKQVTVSRVQAHVTYPANFQLIAAMNPCKCGYLAEADRACNKAPKCAVDYQAKLSGPLLDRFDIYLDIPSVSPLEMFDMPEASEGSAEVAKRVAVAHNMQKTRYINKAFNLNVELDTETLEQVAMPEADGMALLKQGVEKLGLSMRGYHRVLRVARTIADLAGSEKVLKAHIAEALSYRQPIYAASQAA